MLPVPRLCQAHPYGAKLFSILHMQRHFLNYAWGTRYPSEFSSTPCSQVFTSIIDNALGLELELSCRPMAISGGHQDIEANLRVLRTTSAIILESVQFLEFMNAYMGKSR